MNIELRREIKYNFKDYTSFYIKKNIIKKNNLRKLFDDRIVQSIYFDTDNLKCANDNLAGLNSRKKFRIRWYDKNNSFNFEIKEKENQLSKKRFLDQSKFEKNFTFNSEVIKKFLRNNKLSKICLIKYLRSYYMYRDLRVTFDRNISYYSFINNSFSKMIKSDEKIIEIKFTNSSNNLNFFTFNFPIVSSRNSKYLNSLNYLGILKF